MVLEDLIRKEGRWMNLIGFIDIAAVACSVTALALLIIGRREAPFRAVWLLLVFIVILTVCRDFGNMAEWTGLTGWFDPVEDYIEILMAALWPFFFYTYHQRTTEKQIRELKELDEKILDGSPVAFVLHDKEMRIVRASRAYHDVTGIYPDRVIGKTLGELMPDGREKEGIVRRLAVVMEKGVQVGPVEIVSPFEGKCLRETILPIFNEAGSVTNTLAVLEDVTEQKKASDNLKESEKRYRTLFEGTHDGVVLHEILHDGQPGRFLQANEAFCRIVERSREELSEMTPLDVLEPDEKIGGRIRGGTLKANQSTFFERALVTGSGRHVPCEIRSDILKLGERTVVLSVVRDITERKESEERIRASLAEKEVLLREIHHRVKNNLQVISGLLDLHSHEIHDPVLRTVYRESQSQIVAMALVHEKLYQSNDMSRVHFEHYLHALCNNLMASFGVRDGHIELNIDSPVPEIVMDTAIPCGLIINELVTNSLKHAFPKGRRGSIYISFRKSMESKGSETGYEMVVSDDGVGLPEGMDIGNAKSLGLNLVSILVQQLGGTLEVDCEKGTCFRMTIREYHEAGTILY
jgi:PAS domain S-box-containing protein